MSINAKNYQLMWKKIQTFFGKAKDNTHYKPLDKKIVTAYNKTRENKNHKTVCYAPEKMMYFGHKGFVYACTANRSYVLGRFPAQSIQEMWFGEKAAKLRKYIRHNDLTLGCANCETQFCNQNFHIVKARQYDTQPLNKSKYPSVLSFELSNTCNLECVMCSGTYSSSIRKNREKLPPLPTPYDANFVAQLEAFIPHLSETKFYGGEPFLVDIYYDIWEKIVRINPNVIIQIQTNATILNQRVKNLLENGTFNINISLDSLHKPTYESIRKNAKLDKVLENIAYFNEYCKKQNTFIGISVCPMRQNWCEMPDFIDFCNELEVPVYFHTVWNPLHCSLWNLPAAELIEIEKFLKQKNHFSTKTSLEQDNQKSCNDLLRQVTQWKDYALELEKENLFLENKEHWQYTNHPIYARMAAYENK